MAPETGHSRGHEAKFSSSFGSEKGGESINAGDSTSLPVDRPKNRPSAVDGSIRHVPAGVNPVRYDMDQKLNAYRKSNEYNKPMGRSEDLDWVPSEHTGKIEVAVDQDAGMDTESAYENNTADVNGEVQLQDGRAMRKELQQLLGTRSRDQWGQDLNIRQAIRKLTNHRNKIHNFLQENPALDKEVVGRLEGQIGGIESDLETTKQLTPDRPKQMPRSSAQPSRTALPQAMRMQGRPDSNMRKPQSEGPVTRFFDKLKFWK